MAILRAARSFLEKKMSLRVWLAFLFIAFAASCTQATPEAGKSKKDLPEEPKLQWGTSALPFAADSPWNSRPIKPVLGDAVIPPSQYAPAILSNRWSTGVFVSKDDDPPITVRGVPGSQGVWNTDDHTFHDVTIPRWPSDVQPASESDGHADIVDPKLGIIHSFWQLRHKDGQWQAAQYAWSSLHGRGWGDGAHYFQGARATGVPTMAGLIRKHEVNDGLPMYRHALAMSLTVNALSPKPSYVFPATSADKEAEKINYGKIPQGTLMMLPSSFDTSRLSDPRVRKVAETLKTYGAYVVDRNDGTPFAIYAEIGSGLDLHKKSWNKAAVDDLQQIRMALRPVISAEAWLDGRGRPHKLDNHLNLISMRGPWDLIHGKEAGIFDTWSQAVLFPHSLSQITQVRYLPFNLNDVAWAKPVPGKTYRLKVVAAGGASLRLMLSDASSQKTIIDSGELKNGQIFRFVWPSNKLKAVLYASSGIGTRSSVSADLRLDATISNGRDRV